MSISKNNTEVKSWTVTGFSTGGDVEERWVCVAEGQKQARVRLDELLSPGGKSWPELANQGIVCASQSSKQKLQKQVDDIKDWPLDAHAVSRPGPQGGYFVCPDGTVIGQ